MTAMLRIVCRVVERRTKGGESLEQVLDDYPRLTETEIAEIKAELGMVE